MSGKSGSVHLLWAWLLFRYQKTIRLMYSAVQLPTVAREQDLDLISASYEHLHRNLLLSVY